MHGRRDDPRPEPGSCGHFGLVRAAKVEYTLPVAIAYGAATSVRACG